MTHWKNLADYTYLGAYSLNDKKEMTITIKDIKQELVTGNAGRKENCIVAYFSDSDKPMILNKTNCKTIQKVYGTPNIEEWCGKKITIFASTTSLAGETVECLRIRPYPPTPEKPAPKCEGCGANIVGMGKMTAEGIAVYTEKKYGKKLCAACATEMKKQIDQAEEAAEIQNEIYRCSMPNAEEEEKKNE